MGYQPTTRPELLSPPGNSNVYCGECSTKIDDDMYACPKCSTAFVSRWQLRPPNHNLSSVYNHSGKKPKKTPLRKCLQCHTMKREDFTERCQACHDENDRECQRQVEAGERFPLDRNLMYHPYLSTIPEPHDYVWYFLKWFEVQLTNHILDYLGHLLSRFLPDPKPEIDLIQWPIGEDVPSYPPEPLLRLPVQHGDEIEPPSDAHVAIHQIGTAEPIGWFDSAGKWYESLPHADHSEMQFAPSDWSNEMATIQVVFLKIDVLPEQAQEQAQALYDVIASRYGQYVEHTFSGLLTEYSADISRVGYHIRAYLKAPEQIVTQIKQEYDEAKPYQPWEGIRWE